MTAKRFFINNEICKTDLASWSWEITHTDTSANLTIVICDGRDSVELEWYLYPWDMDTKKKKKELKRTLDSLWTFINELVVVAADFESKARKLETE